MYGAITYTLPTMQLVCHLVAVGPSNIGSTIRDVTQRPTTPTPRLPTGYVAYPDFGAAYKFHNEIVSWHVAKDRCAQEGAYLALIDSYAKIEVVRNQDPSRNLTHVGFHLMDSNLTWYSAYTGLPVETLPWASDEPTGDGRCVVIKRGDHGLGRYSCTVAGDYVCQIDYPVRDQPIDVRAN